MNESKWYLDFIDTDKDFIYVNRLRILHLTFDLKYKPL